MIIGRYASRLLREHLLESPMQQREGHNEFEGVLLFVDIADSTAMSDRFAAEGPDGAERLGGILNLYFGDVFALVEGHGGDTIRIDGDAVLALWREEPGQAGAVLRCARAAIALREAFHNWRPELDVRMRHRLTLGAGQLRAAGFRNEGDRSFLVVTGKPIHAIADASHAGEPNEIILTEKTVAPLQALAAIETTASGFWRLRTLNPEHADGVNNAAPSAPAFPADALVREFLPRIVVDRAESGHSTWLAEFRVVSMAYVHLIGQEIEGADASMRIQAALRVVHEAIRELRVVIYDLVVGDKGVMIVVACGMPPFAQENNAVRALEAARRITANLAEIGVGSSIGVATGRAFCGDVGNAARREYLMTGPVMNYSARLMQAANGSILTDDATARAAEGHFKLSLPSTIAIKGRARPLTVYRVDATERAALRMLRLEGALHGRDDEAAQLVARFDRAGQDIGGLVAIEAEPGAGKSRLLAHVGFAAQASGCTIILTATSPIEVMTAYYAFRPVVRQLLLLPTDPPVPEPSLLRRRLGDALRGNALEAKAALIEDILPLGIVDKGFAGEITGPARLAGLEDILVRLVTLMATDRPLVLLVDDLHWLDDPSARLLLALAKRVPRVFVATATRPLEAATGPHVKQLLDTASPRVHLKRLTSESITRIVAETLSVRTIPARLGEFVQARSEGLPFHAEQLALSLRDQGLLDVVDGKCRILVSDLSSAAVVDNLRDVIVSRIDTLDSTHQLATRVASAIGRTFEVAMLANIYPFRADVPRLAQILERLVSVGILEPAIGPAGMTYTFRHILIQEVTYELLTFEKRVPLHQAIAQFIEERNPADLEPHFAELASHWERAGALDKAIGYREQAAMVAVRRYANHDALNHVEKIERLAAQMNTAMPQEQEARLALIRGDACQELSRFAEAQKHLMACAALSGIPVPSTRTGVITSVLGEVTIQLLHRMGIVRKTSVAATRDRDRLAAHIYTRFAEHAYFTGDALGLVHATLASLNRAERVSSVREIVEGFGGLAIGLGTAGMHGLADFYRKRSVARAEVDGGLHDQGFAQLLAAVYSFQAGRWETALQHCTLGADICLRIGDRFRYQSCRVIHAYSELLLGNYSSAEDIFRAFGEDAESVENGPVRAWILVGRAIIDMILGRPATLALGRISSSRDEHLHRAERLLCDGLEAIARLHAGESAAALRAATAALDNMLESAPTMGIALLSVASAAEVHLALAELSDASYSGRNSGRNSGENSVATLGDHYAPTELVARARIACKATRLYAIKTRICQPRALLLSGRLALLLRRPNQARRHLRLALSAANDLRMPLEQALCHLALAGTESTPDGAAMHRQRGLEILERLGAKPWFCDIAQLPPCVSTLAGETVRAA